MKDTNKESNNKSNELIYRGNDRPEKETFSECKTVIVGLEPADYDRLQNICQLRNINMADYIEDAVIEKINKTGETNIKKDDYKITSWKDCKCGRTVVWHDDDPMPECECESEVPR